MERGQLGVNVKPATVFVFEGLIATLERHRVEKMNIRARRWGAALDNWQFDFQVCDYMHTALSRLEMVIDVVTWRPMEFAELLHDRLWNMDVPVRETFSSDYRSMSPRVATDTGVTVVYDADPAHRFGYGYKARDFNIGRY